VGGQREMKSEVSSFGGDEVRGSRSRTGRTGTHDLDLVAGDWSDLVAVSLRHGGAGVSEDEVNLALRSALLSLRSRPRSPQQSELATPPCCAPKLSASNRGSGASPACAAADPFPLSFVPLSRSTRRRRTRFIHGGLCVIHRTRPRCRS